MKAESPNARCSPRLGTPRRGAARVAALLAAAGLAAAASSGCATVQRDLFVSPAAESDFARLDSLAGEDASLRASPDKAALAAARSEAASLRASQPLNPDYRARLAAISGDLALLASDRASAASSLASAQAERADDEWVFLLRSRLAQDDAARESPLAEGIAKAADSSLLSAELGSLRFKQGRYREAVAALDGALDHLSRAERALYAPIRDRALALKDAEGGPKGLGDYIASNPLSLLGMVVIVQDGTDLLNYLTGAKAWAAGVLFSRLEAAGLLGPEPLAPTDPATRARAAYLLWNLLSVREENPALLRAYSGRYAGGSSAASGSLVASGPVPDVAPGSWYFDAALGCVERELLALPDGLDFLPEGTVSGAELLKAARKAME
jgi:hypothetical protein